MKGKMKEKRGITLIALVVTIVVLLILAGITINMLFSNGGIFKVAGDAANAWNEATINEQESLTNIAEQIGNLVNGQTGGGSTPEEPLDITTVTDTNHETIKAKDNLGNIVTVPKGFKVVTSEGTTVPEGIVIEDVNGNQFVWVPVGTVHKDNNPENDVTIKLGRYTFDKSNGTPTPVQLAYTEENPTNYINEVGTNKELIVGIFTELSTPREGKVDSSNRLNDLNTTAKNLAGFVEKTKENGGYYIARYEASYGSGYNSSGSTDTEKYANAKPLSKVSTASSDSSMSYVTGTLWNFIAQLDASKVSQNMYKNDNSVGVESDLINSYAWDTAIVFIQSMKSENSNYANKDAGNGILINTGKTEDKACNIYDMAVNLSEWTTEYSTFTDSSGAHPCTLRGGNYSIGILYYTANRNTIITTKSDYYFGFRVALYIK